MSNSTIRSGPRHRSMSALLLLIGISVADSGARATAAGTENRFTFVRQDAWEKHLGFNLGLENSGAPGEAGPLQLKTLKLAIGAADGAAWQYAGATPAWTTGHAYHLAAKIEGAAITLSLDGREVARGSGVTLAPADGDAVAGEVPDWADAPTDYVVLQQSVIVTADGRELLRHEFAGTSLNPAERLFAPPTAWHGYDLHPQPGQPLQIEIVFTIEPQPHDLHAFAPLVDRYGQSRYGDWPGKVTTDSQLIAGINEEQKRSAVSADHPKTDPYGGDTTLGWKENPTGFFHVARHAGKWWLITPTGSPCFYTGISNAPILSDNSTPVKGREYLYAALPPKSDPFSAAWSKGIWGETGNEYVSFDTVNMIRKYGEQHWRDEAQSRSIRRIHSWGFTGLGKWVEPYGGLPWVGVLQHPLDPSSGHGKLDVFDPAACAAFRDAVNQQIAPHRKDPLLVGWSVGNERPEIVLNEDVAALLAAPTASPAKRAIVRFAADTNYHSDVSKLAAAWHTHGDSIDAVIAGPLTAPAADVEPVRQFFAKAYYAFLFKTVKSLDADHLYLGFWIVPGWWQNESDWSLISPYCDVIGYDRYADHFADDMFNRLTRQSDKPVLCGEFSYPPTYEGRRGFGVYPLTSVPTEAAAGDRYQQWIKDATLNPYCVGGMWFEYRDEPITGRGPGSGPNLTYDEHYAFGVVDVTDTPKWPLVEKMQAANATATKNRNRVTTVGP